MNTRTPWCTWSITFPLPLIVAKHDFRRFVLKTHVKHRVDVEADRTSLASPRAPSAGVLVPRGLRRIAVPSACRVHLLFDVARTGARRGGARPHARTDVVIRDRRVRARLFFYGFFPVTMTPGARRRRPRYTRTRPFRPTRLPACRANRPTWPRGIRAVRRIAARPYAGSSGLGGRGTRGGGRLPPRRFVGLRYRIHGVRDSPPESPFSRRTRSSSSTSSGGGGASDREHSVYLTHIMYVLCIHIMFYFIFYT